MITKTKNVGKGRRNPACQLAIESIGFQWENAHSLNQKAHTMSEINIVMCSEGQTVRAMFIFTKVFDS